MGIGDDIMLTGEAKRLQQADPRPVYIVRPDGRAYGRPEVFENNPRITDKPEGAQRLVQGGGQRPYIVSKGLRRWVWKPYKPEPGEFYFTAEEESRGRAARGTIVIEPSIKRSVGHQNKAWPWDRWLVLAALLKRDYDVVQLGDNTIRSIPGVRRIPTERFRIAAAALKHAAGLITTEGGLHHAAAAVGLPAVVIYTGFIGPQHTGYDMHVNLAKAKEYCGSRINCVHCAEAASRIAVDMVLGALIETQTLRQQEAA